MACAVVLRAARLPVCIDDSKRLTPLQRERAFRVIARHADVGFGAVCAEEIDRRNILRATLHAMRLAVADLPEPPELVLIDGNALPELPVPCRAIVGGDRSTYCIAAASIMAKVLRDRLMTFYHRLDPRYAFHRHKGYGTALHRLRLSAHGPSVFHRASFRPVASASAAPAAADG